MAAVARGDASALRVLYDRHERMTFNLVLRLAGRREMAEELMQERSPGVDDGSPLPRRSAGGFKAWLFTIALNLTPLRAVPEALPRPPCRGGGGGSAARGGAGPDAPGRAGRKTQRVEAAPSRLARPARESCVLRIYQQLTFAEIARA